MVFQFGTAKYLTRDRPTFGVPMNDIMEEYAAIFAIHGEVVSFFEAL
jgi:hypothetical protein